MIRFAEREPVTADDSEPRLDREIPVVTALRGIAALWVMAFHLWQSTGQPKLGLGVVDFTPLLSSGHYGVDLFFVLSGFLLGWPFVQARLSGGALPNLRRFWMRRIRRVLPAYWIQIAVLLALGWAAWPGWSSLAMHLTLTFNLIANESAINPVYWSLPPEWNFYMVLPLLALLVTPQRGVLWLLIAALAFSLAFRGLCWFYLHRNGADGVWLARWMIQLPARVDQFVLGMCAAWLVLRWHPHRAWLAKRVNWLYAVGFAVVLGVVYETAFIGHERDAFERGSVFWRQPLVALGFAAIVVAGVCNRSRFAMVWANPIFRWLGLISYSLYLWHLPLISGLQKNGFANSALWLLAPPIVLLVASVSWRVTEKPFQTKNTRSVS